MHTVIQGQQRWWWDAARALARRPGLWWVALASIRSLAPRRWWRRWPPLPTPARAWMEFRMETAYGDRTARPPADDVVAWLAWCQAQMHYAGGVTSPDAKRRTRFEAARATKRLR